MVSFHPIQEEAHLLYYRTIPPKFQYMGDDDDDKVGLIKKPSMDFFITTTAPPPSSSSATGGTIGGTNNTPVDDTHSGDESCSSSMSPTQPCPHHHLQPLSTVRRTNAVGLMVSGKSPSTSTSPLAISKKKKKAQAESVKSFVFSHHRSSSGTSGSYDSAIRNLLH